MWADPIAWLTNIAQAIAGWYTGIVEQTIEFLLMYSVPSPDEIRSEFFSLALGGTFGLSALIVGLIAILIGSLVIIKPRENHARSISRMITSMIWLIVFALLFYRGYGLLYGALQGAGQGVLNLLTGTQGGTIAELNSILLVVTPAGVGAMLVLGPLSVLLSLFALAEAFLFHVTLFGLLIVYPLLIALRPLPVFNTLFHAANSAMVVIALSPIVMTAAFAIPVIVSLIVPGATATVIPIILTFVSGLAAFTVPIFIAVFVFNKSQDVFGAVEAQVSGVVSISSMPPVDLNEAQRDINLVHDSPIKAIATEVIGDEMLRGDMFRDMSKVAVNAAATGFAAAGHPYVGAVIKATPTVIENVKGRFSEASDTKSPERGDGST